jgi:hypothetical protein
MKFSDHVWSSRPSMAETTGATLVWGVAIPLCLLADHLIWRHMLPPDPMRLMVIFAIGSAFAAPLALWAARIIGRSNTYTAFASSFVALGVGTIGLTALTFAFDFWWYFSQWHGETFSKLWANQFIFTFASAIYQFMVSGIRLYLPFGLVALVIASMWASRRIMR